MLRETNELKNRFLLVSAATEDLSGKKKQTGNRTSTEQVTVQLTEQERMLISAIGHEQLTLKQLMEKVGLKQISI